MVDIIEVVLFIVIPLVVILVAGFLGWRRNIIQSGFKLGSVILSILAAVLILKFAMPMPTDALLSMGGSLIEESVATEFSGSAYGVDLLLVIISIMMPLFFLAVFFAMNSLFSLLYLIPGRLFSNKAIARRSAKKETADVCVAVTDTPLQTESDGSEAISSSAEEPANTPIADFAGAEPASAAGPDWKKIGLKAGSMACSILAGVLVLSSFMLPVSFYADFAASCAETLDLTEIDPDSAEIVDVIHEFDDHFTVNCYQVLNLPVTASLDSFQSHTGTKVVASDTFLDVLEIVSYLNADEFTSAVCYSTADKLDENNFLNETFTGLLLDLLDGWKAGESLTGTDTAAMPQDFLEMMNRLLRNDRTFSVVMRLMGDVLLMNESLQSDDPDALGETVETIVYNMNADSSEAFKELLQTSFGDELGENADMYSDFAEAVLDSIAEIKKDTSMDDVEREEILKQEAESLTKILKLSTEDEDADLVELVDICISSETLTNAVLKSTENGDQKDPYSLANSFTDAMVNEVCDKLQQKGIKEDSSTYKAYLALITNAG